MCTRDEVFAIGIVADARRRIAAGRCCRIASPALLWGVALATAIVFYDYRHKGNAFGPVVMGACRALVYCAAAAGATGVVPMPVAVAAIVMWVYIIALTWVAKTPGLGHARAAAACRHLLRRCGDDRDCGGAAAAGAASRCDWIPR